MIETGSPPGSDEARFGALAKGLRLLAIAGSARFAGTGDYDARPPNFLGYDVRRPRMRQPVFFVPGRVVPPENR